MEHTVKMYFKNGSKTDVAKIYTTTGECGSEYCTIWYNGQTLYAPTGDINDQRATIGRIMRQYERAILKNGKPPYTEQCYWPTERASDSGHSRHDKTGTFTVPVGVYRIRVAMCDGGRSSSSNGVHNDWHSSYFGPLDSYRDRTNMCKGCNRSFTFVNHNKARDGNGELADGNCGAPYRYRDGSAGYYSGYLDVTPGQVISWRAGRAGNKAGVGFLLFGYGGDI